MINRVVAGVISAFSVLGSAAAQTALGGDSQAVFFSQDALQGFAPLEATAQNASQNAGQNDVQVGVLDAGDLFSIGVLSAREGALPSDLWSDSDGRVIETLLEMAPVGAASPRVTGLLNRLLLSGADASPQNADIASLSRLRLNALVSGGQIEAARSILALAGAQRREPGVAQAAARADLLAGDARSACLRGTDLSSGREQPFWLKLRAFCYALSGEGAAAELTLSLLREQDLLDPERDSLVAALVQGAAPSEFVIRTPLALAAAKALGLQYSEQVMRGAEAGVLAAVATDPDAPDNTRLTAAAEAYLRGAVRASQLRAIYGVIGVAEEDLARAGDLALEDDTPRADAALFQAISSITEPADKAAALHLALVRHADAGQRYVLARLYAGQIASLEPATVNVEFAPLFAASLLAAGRRDEAESWLERAAPLPSEVPEADIAEDEASPEQEVDPVMLANAHILFAAMGEAPQGPLSLIDQFATDFEIEAPASPARPELDWTSRYLWFAENGEAGAATYFARELDMMALLNEREWRRGFSAALDEGWPNGAADESKKTAEPQSAEVEQTSSLRAMEDAFIASVLRDASRDDRIGETLLAALAAIGPEGPARPRLALPVVLDALMRIGFEDEARALAVEALWSDQITLEDQLSEYAARAE